MSDAPRPAPSSLDLRGVRKSFDGGWTFAVDGVSLSIAPGAFTALVGASGSGKTTLLKTINRLVEPDAGEVRIDGRLVGEQPAPELRRTIGYAFQGVGLFPHLSVAENIGVTPRLLGWERARIAARTAELIALVGLGSEHLARAPDQLSGGQQQRVGLARALAAEPRVLLLDEPFGALDAVLREDLGAQVRAIHDRLGLTTVMVTHDVMEAVLLADTVAVMHGGKLLAHEAPGALLAGHPDPFVRALMESPRRLAERVAELTRAHAS